MTNPTDSGSDALPEGTSDIIVVDVDDTAPQGQQTVEVTITTGPLKGMVATVPAPADPNPPILLDWLGLIGTMHVANDSIQLDIA